MNKMKHILVALLLVSATALTSIPARAGCLASIEAGINWGNGKAYFFGYMYENDYLQYVRYDIKTGKADPGYPKPVNNTTWPGLDMDDVMAAINWGDGKAYFFGMDDDKDGMYYVRYDLKANKADPGYPALVTDDNWPGLSMLAEITGALDIGDGNVYFFGYNFDYSENQIGVTFNKEANSVLEDTPEDITPDNSGGNLLPSISAAVDWGSKFYLFGWDEYDDLHSYERFTTQTGAMDQGYPQAINAKTWPGMGCTY